MDNLDYGMRLGRQLGIRPQKCITTTPLPIPIIRRLKKIAEGVTGRVVMTGGASFDNAANVSESQVAKWREKMLTRTGRQEVLAELLLDAPGALWNSKLIDDLRLETRADAPEFARICVAVDPTVSDPTKGRSGRGRMDDDQLAECGIVVAALADNGQMYVLEDLTIKAHPSVWANVAVGAYHRWNADVLVGEQNQGGKLIEVLFRSIDPHIHVQLVNATKGKHVRAEPISDLYYQGKVHHIGMFPELEEEMCAWVPLSGMKSPNRIDALVWAGTELMISGGLPLVEGGNLWPGWRG